MFGKTISGAVLSTWRRKKAKGERHLVQAKFVAPLTDGLISAIDDTRRQGIFRFMLDGEVLESARIKLPDGLVTLSAKCKSAGDNGAPTTAEITVKDCKPTRVELRSPGDDEPSSVAITVIFRADDAAILHLWHTEGEKTSLKLTPQKVAKQTTTDDAVKRPAPASEATADAPPPAA